MTKLERQKEAVSMAVKVALQKLGQDRIKEEEFFGTNNHSVGPKHD